MSITIPTVYIYNIKNSVTIIAKNIGYVRNKWINDYSYDIEKRNLEYIRREFKL